MTNITKSTVTNIMALYFAYGSNLLASRMHVQNPNATRVGSARLEDHRLDFNFVSKRWGGHAATIVPHPGQHLWGALWMVDDLESLDNQEGVHQNIYFPKNVTVTRLGNISENCRTYQLVDLPSEGSGTQPSRVYLEVILQGAKETGLPDDYINFLKKIKHNGFKGPTTIPGLNIYFTETSPIHFETENR